MLFIVDHTYTLEVQSERETGVNSMRVLLLTESLMAVLSDCAMPLACLILHATPFTLLPWEVKGSEKELKKNKGGETK